LTSPPYGFNYVRVFPDGFFAGPLHLLVEFVLTRDLALLERPAHFVDLGLGLFHRLDFGPAHAEPEPEDPTNGHSEPRSAHERSDHGRIDRPCDLGHFLEIGGHLFD
jgi:hypothetical protein